MESWACQKCNFTFSSGETRYHYKVPEANIDTYVCDKCFSELTAPSNKDALKKQYLESAEIAALKELLQDSCKEITKLRKNHAEETHDHYKTVDRLNKFIDKLTKKKAAGEDISQESDDDLPLRGAFLRARAGW